MTAMVKSRSATPDGAPAAAPTVGPGDHGVGTGTGEVGVACARGPRARWRRGPAGAPARGPGWIGGATAAGEGATGAATTGRLAGATRRRPAPRCARRWGREADRCTG
jgi:hypothetical protein